MCERGLLPLVRLPQKPFPSWGTFQAHFLPILGARGGGPGPHSLFHNGSVLSLLLFLSFSIFLLSLQVFLYIFFLSLPAYFLKLYLLSRHVFLYLFLLSLHVFLYLFLSLYIFLSLSSIDTCLSLCLFPLISFSISFFSLHMSFLISFCYRLPVLFRNLIRIRAQHSANSYPDPCY